MNRITLPADCTSFKTALSRSSNSPRYFVPAIRAPISRATTRRFFRLCGTSPCTIRRANPSAMAVLPTPGSPISTGLFFVRRDRTWITRRISWSRPITGSSLPWLAARPGRCRTAPGPGTWPRASGPHPGAAAHGLQGLEDLALADRVQLEHLLGLRVGLGQRQQQMFGRDELVLHQLGLLGCGASKTCINADEGCGGCAPEDWAAA